MAPRIELETIKQAQQGDEEAIAALLQALQPLIGSSIARLGPSADREALQQEAAVILLTALPRFDSQTYGVGHFLQWLAQRIRYGLSKAHLATCHSGPYVPPRYRADVVGKLARGEPSSSFRETAARQAMTFTAELDAVDRGSSEDLAESVAERVALAKAWPDLTDRERLVLVGLFGLHGQEPMTDAELAPVLSIDRSNVSRTKTAALQKLRRLAA